MTRTNLRGILLLVSLVPMPVLCGCGGGNENRVVGEDHAEFRMYAEQAAAEHESEGESQEE